MLYLKPPQNFSPAFSTVACIVEYSNEILFLLRQDNKREGNTWGLPAGKINTNESDIEAMMRELFEETGIKILAENLVFVKHFYVRYEGDCDFDFIVFKCTLQKKPLITININEHKKYIWLSLEKAKKCILTRDLKESLENLY